MRYLDFDEPLKHGYKLKDVPLESHYSTFINEDTIVRVKGKITLLYLTEMSEFKDLLGACNQLKFVKSTRSRGLETMSNIFGYAPRNERRKLPCRATKMTTEYQKHFHLLEDAAKFLGELYQKHNPEQHEKHKAMTLENNRKEYTLSDGVFTSGNINLNTAVRYHYDFGNYANVWSAMITLKKGIQGGYLSVPEFGLGIELSHKSALFFDGQSIMHGVTPIIKLKKESKRYTIVYYSLKALWRCLEYKDEIKQMNKHQEQVMLNKLAAIALKSERIENRTDEPTSHPPKT
jgi:hypothetical protein